MRDGVGIELETFELGLNFVATEVRHQLTLVSWCWLGEQRVKKNKVV